MKKEERIYRNSEVSEKALEQRLVTEVKKLGFMIVKNFDPMNGGMPDRLIVMPGGKTAWVELKTKGNKPTPLQAHQIKRLCDLGHIVFVVDHLDELDRVITYISFYKQK